MDRSEIASNSDRPADLGGSTVGILDMLAGTGGALLGIVLLTAFISMGIHDGSGSGGGALYAAMGVVTVTLKRKLLPTQSRRRQDWILGVLYMLGAIFVPWRWACGASACACPSCPSMDWMVCSTTKSTGRCWWVVACSTW